MEELRRKRRILNMMIDMHSFEKEKYRRLSGLIDISLIVLAASINSLAFTDFSFLLVFELNIDQKKALILTQIVSTILFVTSIVVLYVNWKQKIVEHETAMKSLFMLKNRCTKLADESDMKHLEDFDVIYESTMNSIVAIPNKRFNRLKAKHLRKVEFSRYISNNPDVAFFVLKIKFFFKSFNNEA